MKHVEPTHELWNILKQHINIPEYFQWIDEYEKLVKGQNGSVTYTTATYESLYKKMCAAS
jgi:hypothetical protein